jgi:hypothetical protein
VQPPQLPADYGGAGTEERGVEAARVADLHDGVPDPAGDGHGVGEVAGQRLLAEHRQPGLHGGQQQRGVGGGGDSDQHPVDAGGEQLLRRVDSLGAYARGDGGAHDRVGVGDHERVDAVEVGERLRVKGADPAEADESESHGCPFGEEGAPRGRGRDGTRRPAGPMVCTSRGAPSVEGAVSRGRRRRSGPSR